MVDDVVFSKLPPLLFQVDAIEEKAKVEIGYVYLSFCGLGLWVCFFFFEPGRLQPVKCAWV